MSRRRITLNQREQTMLLAIAIVLLVWWGSSLLGRLSGDLGDQSRLRSQIRTVEDNLRFSPEVDQRFAQALTTLDAGSFLDPRSFFSRLDSLARGTGLRPNIMEVSTTRSGGGISFYETELSLRSIRVDELIALEEKLRAESPYLQIQRIVINSQAGDAINADFVLSAFEVEPSLLTPVSPPSPASGRTTAQVNP